MSTAVVVLALTVIGLQLLMAVVLVGLLRRQAVTEGRLGEVGMYTVAADDSLPVGDYAPPIAGRDVRKDRTIDVAFGTPATDMTLLAFLSLQCGPCVDLVAHLNRMKEDRGDVQVIAIVNGSVEAVRKFAFDRNLNVPTVADPDAAITKAYHIQRSPTAYVIDSYGRIATSGVVPNSWRDLEKAVLGAVRVMRSDAWVELNHDAIVVNGDK